MLPLAQLAMIRHMLLLCLLILVSPLQLAFAGSSIYYFDDDIAPCEGIAYNDPPTLNGRVEDFLERCAKDDIGPVDEADVQFCDEVSSEFDELDQLSYSGIYSKIANKNAIRQHDRFNGATGPNIYKKYFKKDMTLSSSGNANVGTKLSLIVDTDIGQFPDDPVAMAVVHGFADHGTADILATIGSAKYEGIAMSIDQVNTFFGRPHIPVGVTKDAKAYSDPPGSQPWTEFVRNRYKSRISFNGDAEDALSLYRRTLNNMPDRSVTILAIGHFINLANLLETPADKISKLNGFNLVRRKVKEVIAMAGNFPSGLEWNIEKDINSARLFAANWPTKVTFVGFEIGNVTCGVKHQGSTLQRTNPIAAINYFGFQQYRSYDGCFDAVAALIAGRETSKLYCAVYGQIRIGPDGKNDWIYSSKNKLYHQRYLRIKGDPAKVTAMVAKRIDDYLPDIL